MNVLRFADLVAAGRLSGQRVFIRADLNVPLDDAGHITEDTRIRASMPCIEMALERRRRGDGDLAPRPPDRRRVQARGLARAGRARASANCSAATCRCARTGSTASTSRRARSSLLENCRLNKGEKKNDPALARKMAALCDIFVHDAFGTAHRAEASTYGIARVRADRLRRPAARGRDRRDHQGARRTRSGRWSRSSPAARSRPS